jgi:hypothetical protein
LNTRGGDNEEEETITESEKEKEDEDVAMKEEKVYASGVQVVIEGL